MSEVKQEQGNLSINSENLFPIIKKWLYSDHDIFFRELISNGCDAVTKVQKLEVMGEYQLQEGEKFRVDVIVNPEEKTLKFIDNGIGMTADEVKEYITQIAFSGATDFLEKYKDKTNEDQIIGHFGLGFYSAFMVADKVTIDTLSYQEGAEPVYWECDGDSEYSMSKGNRTTRGTEITLYLNDESYEFSNEYRAREVITKYCSFMPVEIYLSKEGGEQEYQTIEKDELRQRIHVSCMRRWKSAGLSLIRRLNSPQSSIILSKPCSSRIEPSHSRPHEASMSHGVNSASDGEALTSRKLM